MAAADPRRRQNTTLGDAIKSSREEFAFNSSSFLCQLRRSSNKLPVPFLSVVMRVCLNMYESRDSRREERRHKTDFVYAQIVTCWGDAAAFTRCFGGMDVWL